MQLEKNRKRLPVAGTACRLHAGGARTRRIPVPPTIYGNVRERMRQMNGNALLKHARRRRRVKRMRSHELEWRLV
jgi:hypothetical protein